MNNIIGVIRTSLDAKAIAEMSEQINEGHAKTQLAVSAALPVLIGALSRQASRDSGYALANALARDHDGEILRDVSEFIAAGDFVDGDRILTQVLGERQTPTANAVANTAGLESGKAEAVMSMLAPVVMGAVGKFRRARQTDPAALTDLLAEEERHIDKQLPGVISAIGVFLDADGDGEAELTDLLAHGRRGLSRFI